MNTLPTYKALIDTLVERRIGVERMRVCELGNFLPDSHDANSLIERLSVADREILASMLEETRTAAIHDALVVLQEFLDRKELTLFVKGEPLPNLPFGTELFWDFMARSLGETWPDERA
jgi:hypothetical protein